MRLGSGTNVDMRMQSTGVVNEVISLIRQLSANLYQRNHTDTGLYTCVLRLKHAGTLNRCEKKKKSNDKSTLRCVISARTYLEAEHI